MSFVPTLDNIVATLEGDADLQAFALAPKEASRP